jgi:DNA-binding transcriptional ArsR family regulator
MVRIEDDLLDALSKARIRGKDWQLICCILKLHNRKEYITISQFSHRTGISMRHVSNGLGRLISRNIILKYVEDTEIYYTINENTAMWIDEIKEIEPGDDIIVKPDEIKVSKFFFEFYNMYPNKVNFLLTKKKWAELNPDDELAQYIIKRLKLFIRSEDWNRDGGKWIPAAHTFIMYRRWEDEPKIKKGWKE